MKNPFDFIFDIGNYKGRKVGRDRVGKYEVSTAFTSDCGYETAIILPNGGIHPVERYELKKNAFKGHKKWCKDIKTLKQITDLGHPWGIKETIIKL